MFTKDMSIYKKIIVLLESIIDGGVLDEDSTIVVFTPEEIAELKQWYDQL
jgi:hypothetical protein